MNKSRRIRGLRKIRSLNKPILRSNKQLVNRPNKINVLQSIMEKVVLLLHASIFRAISMMIFSGISRKMDVEHKKRKKV